MASSLPYLSSPMNKGRLEAFSDGVIAILITILVLELKVPRDVEWSAIRALVPQLLTYVLSFAYLAIYWNNHHHMFQLVSRVSGGILWANLHLLFWLSLVPFVTGWMGENHFAPLPTALYGVVLLLAALAYYLLQTVIIRQQGAGSPLLAAIGRDIKGKVSPLLYAVAIPAAYVQESVADGIYVLVALIWLVPDRRIETHLARTRQ
jgi:uncharacterized membrane protein